MPDFEITSPEGKRYRVTGPEGATQEQAYQILQQQLGAPKPKPADPQGGSSWENRMVRFGRGEARGVAGVIQAAGEALPGAELPFLPERAREARRQASSELTQFAQGGKGIAEGAGKVVGGAAPFMLQPELGAARLVGPTLGRIAETALVGGEAGAASAPPGERARGAAYGAAAGGLPAAGGAVLRGTAGVLGSHLGRHGVAAWMSHMAGMPWWTWPAFVPLAMLATRAGGTAGRVLPRVPGAVSGTIGGQQAGDADGDQTKTQSRYGEP